jgi:predicted dehydrogenase
VDFEPRFLDLPQAVREYAPEYVVIANHTSEHFKTFTALAHANFKGLVLVEKPLFDEYRLPPSHEFSAVAVGYNLRFHPLLTQFKRMLTDEPKIISASIYCGSYLPDWRPQANYRDSYSAKKTDGGGVLRDLSHELDYAFWLLGPWKRLTAIGGHLSTLDIDSDDVFGLLIETTNCPLVTMQINYLDRTAHREIIVNTSERTFRVDLIHNTLTINGLQTSVEAHRDDTYREQHLAMMNCDFSVLCSLPQAIDISSAINAAEESAQKHSWIER